MQRKKKKKNAEQDKETRNSDVARCCFCLKGTQGGPHQKEDICAKT